jgi:cytochrome c oxidase subunit II
MALAIVLVLIAVGSVAFQLLSPWWLTPLASNWGLMDDTLLITLVITGEVFVFSAPEMASGQAGALPWS